MIVNLDQNYYGKEILTALELSGYRALKYLPSFQNDREIVKLAVTKNGLSLELASENLRDDKEIVRLAVTENGHALQYASDDLRKDREIVEISVTENGLAL